MRRLDIEFIRSELNKRGYKLLSTVYKGAEEKLVMVCPEGHTIELSWAKFKKGRRCKYCNKSRIWFEDIVELFKKDEYILHTKESEYISSKKTKLKFTCNKGHFGEITLAHWKSGIRCKICYVERLTFKFEYVKREIEKFDYRVLSDKRLYVNSKTKLKCVCDKEHVVYISWNSWKAGTRCKKCSLEKRDEKTRLKYKFVKKEFEKRGRKLLSERYVNAFGKLDYICIRGHVCSTRWNDFQQNYGCIYCTIEDSKGSGSPNWKGVISKELYCQDWTKDLKDFVKERDGHRCLNPYCNSKSSDKLAVHHINYNKKSCGPENLITVCRGCNVAANYDRDWHQLWYEAILCRRYNYKY